MIEGYAYARANQAHQIGELGGVVRLALSDRGVPVVEVSPSSLKKLATGKGNASKDAVLAEAMRRLGYQGSDNNEADALWLLEMARQALDLPGAVDLPKAHRSAVDPEKWEGCVESTRIGPGALADRPPTGGGVLMAETAPAACGAPTGGGDTCATPFGLCPECGRCFSHCEHRKADRKEARSKGARVTNRKNAPRDVWLSEDEALPRPETLADCATWLSTLAWAVSVGHMTPDRADKARASVRDLKDLLLKDQEQRIDELRKVVDQLKRDRKAGR